MALFSFIYGKISKKQLLSFGEGKKNTLNLTNQSALIKSMKSYHEK